MTDESGHTARSCPFCGFTAKAGQVMVECPSCRSTHHSDCWDQNGGCAVVGCASAGSQSGVEPKASRGGTAAPTQRDPSDRRRLLVPAIAVAVAAIAVGALVGLIATSGSESTTAASTQQTVSTVTVSEPASTETTTVEQPVSESTGLAGDWVGSGTQVRPSGRQDAVEMKDISLSSDGNGGLAGSWAEDAAGEYCSGRVTTSSVNGSTTVLSYRNTDNRYNCAATATIRLTDNGDGTALFDETYYTRSSSGRVYGTLRRN